MAGGPPLPDDSGLPVDVGAVSLEPGELKDQWQAWLFQDVKADLLMVVSGQKYDHGSSLVSDGGQALTCKSLGLNYIVFVLSRGM